MGMQAPEIAKHLASEHEGGHHLKVKGDETPFELARAHAAAHGGDIGKNEPRAAADHVHFAQRAADDAEAKAIVESLQAATKSLAEMATKYSADQSRDDHGRFGEGSGLVQRANVESHITYMMEQDHA